MRSPSRASGTASSRSLAVSRPLRNASRLEPGYARLKTTARLGTVPTSPGIET